MSSEIKIYKQDITLVADLSSRHYTSNTIKSNTNQNEENSFKDVRRKIGDVAVCFKDKYNSLYGPFESDRNSGNPIRIGGTKLGTVWSTIYKGASNKQYAAQISFAINHRVRGLDVGFYFGRGSSHTNPKSIHDSLIKQMINMGKNVADCIKKTPNLYTMCQSLLDVGFRYIYDDAETTLDEWIEHIKVCPWRCQVISTILFDDKDFLSISDIDVYVTQVLFLMNLINNTASKKRTLESNKYSEYRNKRLSEIGRKGELYILELERKRLKKLKMLGDDYPKHVADISDCYGYDILSLDDKGNERYIEVKTTVCKKGSCRANIFYISNNEYSKYISNRREYKIYRVYDIDGSPEFEEIDLEMTNKEPNGFIVSY